MFLWVILKMCIYENYNHNSSLCKTHHKLFMAKICQLITLYEDLKLKNGRGNLERLIVFTSLDYRHLFIKRLYIANRYSIVGY